MEVKEGYGTIEGKEEGVDKNNKQFWKFKIRCEDGRVNTFGLFEYEVGLSILKGQEVYMTWTEKESEGQFGKITYRNLKSIGIDPALSKSDEELAKEEKEVENAIGTKPSNSTSQESIGGGGSPQSTIAEREERKQVLIVRQSALNYATQLAGIYYTWQLQKDPENPMSIGAMSEIVKKTAKEYEEQITRK